MHATGDSPPSVDEPLRTGGLRSILVATDLTDDALPALRAARLLRPRCQGCLHVLHCTEGVGPPRPAASTDAAPPATERGTADRENPEAGVAAQLELAGFEEGDARLHLRAGSPAREIARLARQIDADVVVLGRHRTRGRLEGLFGGTAERVLRTASRPCLVVNRQMRARPRRILVASDLSSFSERAMELAVRWASAWASEAETTPHDIHIELLNIPARHRPRPRSGQGRTPLKRQADRARRLAGPGVKVRPRILDAPLAAAGIFRAAGESRADLVVMGTHREGLARLLFGSVASEVVRMSRWPVVVVPRAGE